MSGIGIALEDKEERSLAVFCAVSDMALLVRLKGNPIDTHILKVYAPNRIGFLLQ